MSDNKGLVVVTGSTAGIGKAIARAFVQQGRIVVVNGRKQNTVDALVQELTSTITSDGPTSDHLKPKVLGVAGDLGTAEGANKFIADVDALASADGLVVDVLINNMGIFESSPFFETPDSEWHRYIDTNFFSSLILSRHWLKGMLQRKQGRIIMLSSGAGEMIVAEMLHYSITKQMQIGLARGLAQLTKGTEVTVNSVLPGPVWTEGVDSMLKEDAQNKNASFEEAKSTFIDENFPTMLLRRFIEPSEIAATVVFLASKGAVAINGSAIRAEAGLIQHV